MLVIAVDGGGGGLWKPNEAGWLLVALINWLLMLSFRGREGDLEDFDSSLSLLLVGMFKEEAKI